MTPDKARDLLEAMEDSCPPPYTKNQLTSRLFEVRDKNHQIVAYHIFEGEADVIVAAPDLAALVAGLRYEYAVQVELDGRWRYKARRAMWTDTALYADWVPDLKQAERDVKLFSLGSPSRIVRRLVTDEAVVE